MRRAVGAVRQDGLLDLFWHPVGMRPPGAGQAVDRPLRAIGLVIVPDLVKLLTRVAHVAASLRDVAHVVRKFQQAQLASCYLILGGQVFTLERMDVSAKTILTPSRSGVAATGASDICGRAPAGQTVR